MSIDITRATGIEIVDELKVLTKMIPIKIFNVFINTEFALNIYILCYINMYTVSYF
jgi:hypothetical protein